MGKKISTALSRLVPLLDGLHELEEVRRSQHRQLTFVVIITLYRACRCSLTYVHHKMGYTDGARYPHHPSPSTLTRTALLSLSKRRVPRGQSRTGSLTPSTCTTHY